MIFLEKDIPIEKLQGRIRHVYTSSFNVGKCKILSYTEYSIKMEVIHSSNPKYFNKVIYVSNPTFFMNLSDEQIDNYDAELPAINLQPNIRFYEK